ncbi:CLUMA_CG021074, isoform A, partial [Clunio marinus]
MTSEKVFEFHWKKVVLYIEHLPLSCREGFSLGRNGDNTKSWDMLQYSSNTTKEYNKNSSKVHYQILSSRPDKNHGGRAKSECTNKSSFSTISFLMYISDL